MRGRAGVRGRSPAQALDARRPKAVRALATRRAQDHETRARLLATAREMFSARGFQNVTVREVCTAANANVASINYHFGDKHGLYREVLDEAVQIMQETLTEAAAAGAGGGADERLRAFISVFLRRISSARAPWIRQLMAHEMADPTDALTIVIEKVIVPRSDYVHSLVKEILGDDVEDALVLRCAMSVMAQFHAAMTNPVTKYLVPDLVHTPASIEEMANHIADFSIGGMRSLLRQAVATRGRSRRSDRATQR